MWPPWLWYFLIYLPACNSSRVLSVTPFIDTCGCQQALTTVAGSEMLPVAVLKRLKRLYRESALAMCVFTFAGLRVLSLVSVLGGLVPVTTGKLLLLWFASRCVCVCVCVSSPHMSWNSRSIGRMYTGFKTQESSQKILSPFSLPFVHISPLIPSLSWLHSLSLLRPPPLFKVGITQVLLLFNSSLLLQVLTTVLTNFMRSFYLYYFLQSLRPFHCISLCSVYV